MLAMGCGIPIQWLFQTLLEGFVALAAAGIAAHLPFFVHSRDFLFFWRRAESRLQPQHWQLVRLLRRLLVVHCPYTIALVGYIDMAIRVEFVCRICDYFSGSCPFFQDGR